MVLWFVFKHVLCFRLVTEVLETVSLFSCIDLDVPRFEKPLLFQESNKTNSVLQERNPNITTSCDSPYLYIRKSVVYLSP